MDNYCYSSMSTAPDIWNTILLDGYICKKIKQEKFKSSQKIPFSSQISASIAVNKRLSDTWFSVWFFNNVETHLMHQSYHFWFKDKDLKIML